MADSDTILGGQQDNTDTAGETGTVDTATSGAQEGAENQGDQVDQATEGQQDQTTDQGEEGKPDDEGKPEGEEGGKDEPKAPETYDLKMPEGMELNQDLMDKFDPILRDLDLDNDQANKLVEIMPDVVNSVLEQQRAAWEEVTTKWVQDLKSDPEFQGGNFDKNVALAQQAVAQFGGDDLKQAFDETGIGNHPALVKFMAKVGKAISEDGFSGQAGESGSKPSMYPNSNMKP